MSLFYSNASTARIISRASTFLLLFLLSYDVLTSPLSLSRLYDDLFPARIPHEYSALRSDLGSSRLSRAAELRMRLE